MTTDVLIGQTFGNCELQALLGKGAMGGVYQAYQPLLGRTVAVKVLSETLSAQERYEERLRVEMSKVMRLEHHHIMPIYDYGIQNRMTYIVMRLLTGGSLPDRMFDIQHRPRLPSPGEAKALLQQIAEALFYAHSNGILHLDLKPSNILFSEQGGICISGFGMARLMRMMPAMTGTGVVLGTPAYMAPEQWRGEELSPAADQYVLGIVMYQLITGVLPFDAPSPFALMHQHLFQQPEPAHTHRPGVPEAVSSVLNQALAKTPGERFSSVVAFAEAFEQAVEGAEGEPTGFFQLPQPVQSRRHIFISYSRVDAELMRRVRESCTSAGFNVWTDDSLTPGTPSWKDKIENAIENAGGIIVILSPDAKQSEWVKRELDYGMVCGIPIFPVLARGDERNSVPFLLISAQRVDIRNSFDEAMTSLMTVIRQQIKQ
jgi:serine/threonine protein kinase